MNFFDGLHRVQLAITAGSEDCDQIRVTDCDSETFVLKGLSIRA